MPADKKDTPVKVVLFDDSETGDTKKKGLFLNLSEDGWAKWIGSLLIALVLAMHFFLLALNSRCQLPMGNTGTLQKGKVLSANNLLLIAGIGLTFRFCSLPLASLALRWQSQKFIAGFALIYVLAIAALLIAGK